MCDKIYVLFWNPLSSWHLFPLSVCNYIPCIEEKESSWLCGIDDEEKKVTISPFVQGKRKEADSIIDGDTDKEILLNSIVKQYVNRISVPAAWRFIWDCN